MKSNLKKWSGWLFEAYAMLLFPFSVALSALKFFLQFEKINPDNFHKTPIVIHEHWLTKNFWHIFMKKYLETKGYKVYWTNYSLLRGGADEGAAHLKIFMQKNEIKDAVLVGISFGAVSAFSYLQRMDGWDRVNKFISVAGPFMGSPAAFGIFFLKGGRQIFPNSSYLKKLTDEPIKHPDKILSISAKHDFLVPRSSSMLPDVRNKIVGAAGHNVLHMFSREVFETIAKEAK